VPPIKVRQFEPADRLAVIDVWSQAGLIRPVNDPHRDIDRKLAIDPEGLLVAVDGETVIGVVMVGYEGHRGWINYLGVLPGRQKEGAGKALVEAAIDLVRERGGSKINLQVLKKNQGVVQFYERLGFVEDPVLSMGLRLIQD